MAATTIPKKLYTTVQYRGDTNNEDGLLGFASPYTKDAAFEKRKSTQDSWAYGSGIKVTIDDEDNCSATGTGGSHYNGAKGWDAAMLFIANCYPRIIDNEPVEGFQIAKSVRRYGWGGGGNVKWRITDPRGFDLEISSENFASVISCSTMVNGVIQGKCVWGRQGANNILLPETSEPFMAAAALTAKVDTKISLKDVNPGDQVEVLSTRIRADEAECVYLGKYFFLQVEEKESTNRYYGTGEFRFNTKQTDKYLFQSIKTKQYFTLGSPKVVRIISKLATPLDKLEVAKTVTAALDREVKIDDVDGAILVSPTKIDLTKVTSSLVPLGEQITTSEWPRTDSYQSDNILCNYDGKAYFPTRGKGTYNNATHQYDYDPVLFEVEEFLADNMIQTKFVTAFIRDQFGYGNRENREKITRTDFKFDDLEMFRVVVTDGTTGITGKIFRGIHG